MKTSSEKLGYLLLLFGTLGSRLGQLTTEVRNMLLTLLLLSWPLRMPPKICTQVRLMHIKLGKLDMESQNSPNTMMDGLVPIGESSTLIWRSLIIQTLYLLAQEMFLVYILKIRASPSPWWMRWARCLDHYVKTCRHTVTSATLFGIKLGTWRELMWLAVWKWNRPIGKNLNQCVFYRLSLQCCHNTHAELKMKLF